MSRKLISFVISLLILLINLATYSFAQYDKFCPVFDNQNSNRLVQRGKNRSYFISEWDYFPYVSLEERKPKGNSLAMNLSQVTNQAEGSWIPLSPEVGNIDVIRIIQYLCQKHLHYIRNIQIPLMLLPKYNILLLNRMIYS